MKLEFYFDIYPWSKPGDVFVQTVPSPKSEGATRYKLTTEVPDPHKPDEILYTEAVEEK